MLHINKSLSFIESLSMVPSLSIDWQSQSSSAYGKVFEATAFNKEILSTEMFPEYGYLVREERITDEGWPDTTLRSAYNLNGDYIGDEKNAKFLCEEKGIRPVLASPSHRVCSVGFSELDNKWYGWSHRAINGFQVGDQVKEGDCAYNPDSMDAFVRSTKEFWDKSEVTVIGPNKVRISTGDLSHEATFVPGKGEWSVMTPEQAREAACDFAESVSSVQAESEESALSLQSLSFVSEPLESLSAKNKDVTKYAWYRFTGKRARKYNDHHRIYDCSVDPNEKIGLRFSKRTNKVHLLTFDALDIEFVLSAKEAQLLLRQCKPFGGKVDGKVVPKGNGELYQMDEPTARRQGPIRQVKSLEGTVENKISAKVTNLYWAGYKIAGSKKARMYFSARRAELVAILKRVTKAASNVASKPVIGTTDTANPLYLKMGTSGFTNVHEAIFDKAAKSPSTKELTEVKVRLFSNSIEVPRFNPADPERKQPYFKGNERQVLRELRNFVMYDQHFSAALSFIQEGKIADKQAVKNRGSMFGIKKNGDFERLTFVTKHATQAFEQEALGASRRIKSFYPRGLFKITVGKTKNSEHTLVLVDLKNSTQNAEQAARSRMLFDMVTENKLELNVAKYADENGTSVTIEEIDVEKGIVRARPIRDKVKSRPYNAKELYTLDGTQVF